MKNQYFYNECVLDNLRIAFEMIMMSLGDESLAYKILTEVSEEFEVIHTQNLKKIRDQKISDNKLIYERVHSKDNERIVNRKMSGRRVYHPTGSYLFYYLVKERLTIEEKKQEALGITPNSTALLFRFFHNLFENDNFLKGSFLPITALFGILYDMNPHIVSKISAHLHGIDEDLETKHRDYRDYKFFAKTGANLIENTNNRFSGLDYFKKVPIGEQQIHSDLMVHLDDDINYCIKFESANEETMKLIEKILSFLAPWGVKPLTPDDIPKYNLSNTRIPKLVHNVIDPFAESEIETIRSVSSMNLKFVEALLSNESVRKNNMNKKIYVPVLNKDGNSYSHKLDCMPEFDKKFILDVAYQQLSKPMKFRQSKNFVFTVEADQKEITKISSNKRNSEVIIPVDSRKLAVKAKFREKDNSQKSVLLNVIPLTLIGLKEGESWISESQLENNHHLLLKLVPVLDASNKMESIVLSIDYHDTKECMSEKMNFFSRWSSPVYKVIDWLSTDLVPQPVNNFLHSLDAVGLFSESKAKTDSLKGALTFTIAINLISLILLLLFFAIKRTFFNSLIITEMLLVTTIVAVSLIFTMKSFFSKQTGVNSISRICNRFSFLSGTISIVVLVSLFTNSWNNLKSAESKNNIIAYPTQQAEINLTTQESTNPAPTKQNADAYKPPDEIAATLAIQKESDVNSQSAGENIVARNVVGTVNVKLPPMLKYLSETIDIDKVEKGNSFTAELNTETNDSAEVEQKNKDKIVKTLNAKITSVDRDSCTNNEVLLTFIINSPHMNSQKSTTLVNKELSIVLESDQKVTQIELFWQEGEFKYLKPLATKYNNQENVQETPNLDFTNKDFELKGDKILNKEENSNVENN